MYYMQRNGKINLESIKISFKDFRVFFGEVYFYFYNKGYFQLAFEGDKHKPCLMEPSPSGYFFLHTGNNKVYPIYEYYQRYDQETLFTVIEILHKYIRIRDDFEVYWKEEAQIEFRIQINKFLRFLDDGYELNDKGWIINTTTMALNDLLNKDLPIETSDEITEQIETAIKMFFHYTTNNEQKKKAINILADVLEPIRDQMLTLTSKEHDKMIFGIVNNYKIRHNNDKQMDDYDKDVWYEWMFHYYLSTIHAVLKLTK
ncbi:hypothetical protein Q0V21_28790 [Paenibacillus sp. 11B]|uniref:hypothetical protein n=1 Tax=unclassified Paenibacillus TaxID=185978 RepID=UPI00264EB243|nr:hypothetical protein [Paenibacillus sp. 11B]MDN8592722.1 hypothetical protein [Paenibacillus sp. 11B]